jgi:hypothetical protein
MFLGCAFQEFHFKCCVINQKEKDYGKSLQAAESDRKGPLGLIDERMMMMMMAMIL